tara:strand:- start:31 stop:390 length:360 start_codon:yes stop_codon:yes gene_type:complete
LYKWVGSALKALIVENREDFDLLKSNGYLSTNKKPEQILERKKQKEKAEKEDWLDVFKDSISGKTFRGNDLSGKKNELEKLALEKLDIDLDKKFSLANMLQKVEELKNGNSTGLNKSGV